MVKSQGLDSFARFYKKYLNVWSVAAAALPVPVTSLRIIPMYAAQRQFLTLYTSLFCFLLLGFAFYARHTIARALAPGIYRTLRRGRKVMTGSPSIGRRISGIGYATWLRDLGALANSIPREQIVHHFSRITDD